jgi:hypothetical protein
MKVINNRKPLTTIPEETKVEKPPLADDYYVGSSTLDYLDDIFGQSEKPKSAVQPEEHKVE